MQSNEECEYLIDKSHFPTDVYRDDYLQNIKNKSEEEVKILMRNFLIPSCSLGYDKYLKALNLKDFVKQSSTGE